jgi:hypothetical protein
VLLQLWEWSGRIRVVLWLVAVFASFFSGAIAIVVRLHFPPHPHLLHFRRLMLLQER